jgi:hypothetical protein
VFAFAHSLTCEYCGRCWRRRGTQGSTVFVLMRDRHSSMNHRQDVYTKLGRSPERKLKGDCVTGPSLAHGLTVKNIVCLHPYSLVSGQKRSHYPAVQMGHPMKNWAVLDHKARKIWAEPWTQTFHLACWFFPPHPHRPMRHSSLCFYLWLALTHLGAGTMQALDWNHVATAAPYGRGFVCLQWGLHSGRLNSEQ